MSVFDDLKGKAQDLISGNEDAIRNGIQKAGNFVDEKTGGKYADQIDAVQNGAGNLVGGLGRDDAAPDAQPAPGPASPASPEDPRP
ncbi:antitoxin [Paenarthrobacter sp. DKR-5]|nr:antitoxin [Paenarthrobacter sp. DKR-5]MBT1002059.1 antitoxin [Paenarthrobacter sp. DKR-5]